MSRFARAPLPALAVAALVAAPAQAHQGNPNFRSVLHDGRLAPGVEVQVLGYDNQVELFDRGHRRVVVYGYNGEP